MSTRVSVSLTLNQAEYLQDLVDDDIDAGPVDEQVARGAARKLERAVSTVVAMQAKSRAKEGGDEPCLCGTEFTCLVRHGVIFTPGQTNDATNETSEGR